MSEISMGKLTADVKLMTMPNFLSAKCLGQTIKIDAGELCEEDAAALWDHWKSFWLAHVAKRRDSLGLTQKASARCTCFEDEHGPDCNEDGCCGQCKGAQNGSSNPQENK